MNDEIGKIFAFFHKIVGRKIKMDNFEDRLRLQKLCYILKQTEETITYDFNWYIRGPYSPPLANDGFNFNNQDLPQLTEEEEETANKLNVCFADDKSDNNFELLASILYIRKEYQVQTQENLIRIILNSKPWFSEEDIHKGVSKLKDAGYISV